MSNVQATTRAEGGNRKQIGNPHAFISCTPTIRETTSHCHHARFAPWDNCRAPRCTRCYPTRHIPAFIDAGRKFTVARVCTSRWVPTQLKIKLAKYVIYYGQRMMCTKKGKVRGGQQGDDQLRHDTVTYMIGREHINLGRHGDFLGHTDMMKFYL